MKLLRLYRGIRDGCKVTVTVDGAPLDPRLDLLDYRPDDFAWGFDGRGPAQLALALLADTLGDDFQAFCYHLKFKRVVLVNLNTNRWTFYDQEILSVVSDLEKRVPFPK